jgi:hypothetical protein
MEVNLKIIKNKVKHLLETNHDCRNSDLFLMKVIWTEEMKALEMTTLEQFFYALSHGKLTHFESVRRCRTKWQQVCPELRGTNYKERKKKTKIIEGDLRTLFGESEEKKPKKKKK